MANKPSTSSPSSRLIQLVLLAASLGVIGILYLLRKRPAQPVGEASPSIVQPIVTQQAETLQPETPRKREPLTRGQQFAVLVLTFVYGIVLLVLHDLKPEYSGALLILTGAVFGGFLLWRMLLVRIPVRHILSDIINLPIRFYGQGATVPNQPESASSGSYRISAVFLCGTFAALVLLPTLPMASLGFVILIIMVGVYGWLASLDVFILERRFSVFLRATPAIDVSVLSRLSRRLLLVEMVIIVLTTLATTRPFYESPANWQISGSEAEWLTSTIYSAHAGLVNYGRIPRWQPFIAHGEPTIENPFNFIFNPFAGGPSLILGGRDGLRVSVIICYFMAGLGGWFLGYVMGFGALGRVLLAMILMGKGNIHTALNSSYYQLALSQIYMPWVIGGVIAIMRFPRQRWPLVLTALALTLQLFDGNLWYVLPTAVGALITALVCMFWVDKGRFNRQALRRYVITGVMTMGLSAVFVLPVVLQFNHVGKHSPEVGAGWEAPLTDVVPLFFDPNRDRTVTFFEPAFGRMSFHYVRDVDEFYYSFVIPAWFMLLIFIMLPFYRPLYRRDRLIGLVALGLFLLATLWGSGGKQPILWFYEHIAPLGQWRFVPRALAVASFWLAVLVAMRVDHLWKAIRTADWTTLLTLKLHPRVLQAIPIVLGVVLIGASGVAAGQVNDQWYQYQNIMREPDAAADACTTWLRRQYPNEPLSIWQQDYTNTTTFLNNRVRTWNISADFEMLPQMPTIGPDWLNLNSVLPTFGEFVNLDNRKWGRENGYWVMPDSPKMVDGIPCLSRRTRQALPYAYSIPLPYLDTLLQPQYDFKVDLVSFSPIRLVEQWDDQVALIVTPKTNMPLVVGVQESAYPGWRVQVDGQPARIESVGRQIGVLIPAGDKPVQVYFTYEPTQPLIGGVITLATAVFCILYLLTPRQDWSDF